MTMILPVRYFVLEGQRTSPAVDEIEAVPARFRAAIISDIEQVAECGLRAPVSIKSDRQEMWILHCCKKQDQRHGIEVAAERMRRVRER